MKYYNIKILLVFIILSSVAISSCYKESDWLGDNAELSGKHYPLIPYFEKITSGSDFYFGEDVVFEMNYWCVDPIKESIFFANGEEYLRVPYKKAYSSATRMDSVLYRYKTQELDAKSVKLNTKVIAENGLERKSSEIEIITCPKDLKTEYSSVWKAKLVTYNKVDSITIDTVSFDTSSTTLLLLNKIDDEHYFINDITFGFVKHIDPTNLIGDTLVRDICHFNREISSYKLDGGTDTTFYNFTMDGIVTPDKVFSVNWSLDFKNSSGTLWGSGSGSSDLK